MGGALDGAGEWAREIAYADWRDGAGASENGRAGAETEGLPSADGGQEREDIALGEARVRASEPLVERESE